MTKQQLDALTAKILTTIRRIDENSYAQGRAEERDCESKSETCGKVAQKLSGEIAHQLVELTLAAEAGTISDDTQQLLDFYRVETLHELIAAQERHIVRLQAKLPKDDQPSYRPVRT